MAAAISDGRGGKTSSYDTGYKLFVIIFQAGITGDAEGDNEKTTRGGSVVSAAATSN